MDKNYTNGLDRNYLMDLAFSIVEDGADESHTIEDLNAIYQELKSVSPELTAIRDELQSQLKQTAEELIADARLRQAKTDYLAEHCNWNYKKRCHVKHSGAAAKEMLEVYIADPNEETLELTCRAYAKFFRELSKAMGMKLEQCGRCLNDALNAQANPTVESIVDALSYDKEPEQ